ncbi:putative (+)-borneol dehydrogenase [Helianthus anomalus]
MASMNVVPTSEAATAPRLGCKLACFASGTERIRWRSVRFHIKSGDQDVLSSRKSSIRNHVNNPGPISNSTGKDLDLESGTTPRLAGKVAIITGAAQGIGASTAKLFAKHGAKVIIADIQDDLGQSVCEEIGLENASYVHCDVTLEADVENVVNFATTKYGKLDIMINNAAILGQAKLSILDNDKADFDRVVNVNLAGVFLGMKHAARAMIPAACGSIISIGSVSSAIGGVSPHAYTSTKHAIIGLTKNVAAELGKHGIRVNCVSPYLIPPSVPEEITGLYPDIFANIYSNIKGVALKEEDVAQAILFFGSDESKYISGHNLAVDGGFTTINPGFGLFAPAKSS